MTGFAAEPQPLREAMVAAATRVIDSHSYVLGAEVARFESEWALVSGSSHAVGVASGLDAIEISLRTLGIGPGDEVITTPMTAFATVLGIIRAGATPVLADIDPNTGLLSRESAETCMTSRTRAILLVHLYGQMRNMAAWAALCAERELFLVEDCAQAHLARSGDRPAGSFGPVAAFSFYPTKNLGALGDAGAVVTSDPSVAESAARLRNYGQRERYEHVDVGMNSRLDEMQAAILSARLPWLAEFTARRQQIAGRYREEITTPGVRQLAAPEEHSSHVYHQYVVTCEDRSTLAAHLRDAGVPTLVHYPIPMDEQPALAGVATAPTGLHHSGRHARTCLSLPCHPQLTDDDVSLIVGAVNDFPLR